MSRSHGRATAQNFTEFAQSLEMCTPKLESHAFLPFLHVFAPFYVTFLVFFVYFLAQFFLKLGFDHANKIYL